MTRLIGLGTSWRGVTVSSVFQIPGFAILVICALAVGVTMLLTGHVESGDKVKSPPAVYPKKSVIQGANSE